MIMLAYFMILFVGMALFGWLYFLWRTEQAQHEKLKLVSKRLRRLRPDQRRLDWVDEESPALALLPNWTPDFLRVRIARADVKLVPGVMLGGSSLIVAFLILITMTIGVIFAAACLIVLMGAGLVALEMIASRRLGEFRNGLPGYFDRVRQLLLVGNTLQQSLGRAMATASDESKRYLDPMVRRIEHGATVADAVGWLAMRIDVPELHMFHTAIDTNLRYGGRVTDILANLINMLKDQDRVRRELAATTSETRGSATVLTALPIVIAIGFAIINPSYISFFITESTGQMLLSISIGLVLAGAMMLRRMMKQGGAI